MNLRQEIESGNTFLGIELGSTRIKAVLLDSEQNLIASGSSQWENQYMDGLWTYSMEKVWDGIQKSYQQLAAEVNNRYQVTLTKIGAIGFSAMMHGYLAFDQQGKQLVPFRTWRNTNTEKAAAILSEKFHFHIPLRWSIAHLYQAVIDKEDHVKNVAFFTTLAGYVHWKLTGCKVLGIGDASGMFPIDDKKQYDPGMMNKFNQLTHDKFINWKIEDVLPKILLAGEQAGVLTKEGARLLDVSGNLEPGIPFCPPEGDAGTGMVATNSVRQRTGNVSAGTSVFAMVVLEGHMKNAHQEIDMVTTPDGAPVAMVHCNNCTSEMNAWAGLFREVMESYGVQVDMNQLYPILFQKALEGEPGCGGLLGYNYVSGEPITGFAEGRPIILRTPDSHMTLANFMKMHLYSSLAALKLGLDILIKEEHISLEQLCGHGGFFKTPVVGQKIMSAVVNAPVVVRSTAGEGGAWGIAVLAEFMLNRMDGEDLATYLDQHVFQNQEESVIRADENDVRDFQEFMDQYISCIPVEKAAVQNLICKDTESSN